MMAAMAIPNNSWSRRGRRVRRAGAVLAAVSTLSLPSMGLQAPVAWASAQAGRVKAAAPTSAASFPKTPAGAQAEWLVQAMAHLPVPLSQVRAHFDVQFLSQVPPAQLNVVLGKLGPVTLLSVVSSQKMGLSALVQTKTGTQLTLDLLVDTKGLVRALLFQPYIPTATTWAAVDHKVRSVAPKVGLLVASVNGTTCQQLHSINAQAPLPLGSAFKLYVLDALAEAIAKGKVSWVQRVPVTAGAKSLPTGELQGYPDGTRLTVQAVASKMISISDNTAADMLIDLIGRKNVEAAVKGSGTADPALDVPFLKTRELFALKLADWPNLAKRYLALPASKRLGFLQGTVDRIPLGQLRKQASSWTSPRDVSTLEWFASPLDICHLFAHLASLAHQPKLAPLSSLLQMNNGGLALNSRQWKSVWFKGGSEPGVLTLNYMATTTSGHSYVVSVLAENPSHTIGPTATGTLIGAIQGAFQLAAR
jgi:hypothetical protein